MSDNIKVEKKSLRRLVKLRMRKAQNVKASIQSNIAMSKNGILHRESKTTKHQTLAHNFPKYEPIFKLFSLTDSVVNLQQTHV